MAASAQFEVDAVDRQATANIEEENRQQSNHSTGQTSANVSELSSALEGSSLNDGQLEGGGGEEDDVALRRPAGQRFWEESAASSTSEEGTASRDKSSPKPFVDPFEFDDTVNGFDDPLAFLASVFPDVDMQILESKIATARKSSSSQAPFPTHDLESLIEDLLSQDLITSLIDDDSNAAQLANPPPDFEAEAIAVLSKSEKRRLKQAQKAKNSFSLTATTSAPPSPRPSRPTTAVETVRQSATPVSALARAPSTTNAWTSISSHASHLSSLLHIAPTRISSVYYKNSASLPLTLAVLLKELSHERPFDSLPFSTELSSQFRLVLPRLTTDDEIKVLLSATNGDLSDAIDLKRFIADLEEQQGKVLAYNEMVAPFDPSACLQSTSSGGHSRNSSAGSVEFTPVLPGSRLTGGGQLPSASATQNKPYSSDDCYTLSEEYLEKRNNAFRTAARSFQRGGVGERGAAGYWAEVGRDYERERRKWEERAAKAVVAERRYAVTFCALSFGWECLS